MASYVVLPDTAALRLADEVADFFLRTRLVPDPPVEPGDKIRHKWHGHQTENRLLAMQQKYFFGIAWTHEESRSDLLQSTTQ